MNERVTVIEIANTVLQIAYALMGFGLADTAGGMSRVWGKAHNCRNQTARIEERALDPSICECNRRMRDEIWRMQVKELRVTLVKKGVDRFSPFATLHIVNHDTVVVFIELSEKQQSFGAAMAAH